MSKLIMALLGTFWAGARAVAALLLAITFGCGPGGERAVSVQSRLPIPARDAPWAMIGGDCAGTYAGVGHAAAGRVLWLSRAPSPHAGLPACSYRIGCAIGSDGTCYVPSPRSLLTAYTPDGRVKWDLAGGGSNAGLAGGQLLDAPPWKVDQPSALQEGAPDVPAVSPDGTIYVLGGEHLYSVNPGGRILWEFPHQIHVHAPRTGLMGAVFDGYVDAPVIGPSGSRLPPFVPGALSSPVVAPDGMILLRDEFAGVLAIDPSGALRWWNQDRLADTDVGDNGWTQSAPVPPVMGSDGTICSALGDRVVALTADGSTLWTRSLGQRVSIYSLAFGAGNEVYVGCAVANQWPQVGIVPELISLNSRGRVVWRHRFFPVRRGKPMVSIAADGSVRCAIAVKRIDAVNGVLKDQFLSAFSAAGAVKWMYHSPQGVWLYGKSACLAADGVAYLGDSAISPSGKWLWRANVPADFTASGFDAIAADGTLYVSGSRLAALR